MNNKDAKIVLAALGISSYIQGVSIGLISVFGELFGSLGLTQTQIGSLIFVRSLGSLAAVLIGGALADRIGEGRVLRLSTLAYSLIFVLTGTLWGYVQLLVCFGLLGVFYALVDSSLYPYAVSQFPNNKRAVITFLQFCFGIGALTYPILGVWLARRLLTHAVTFWILGLILVLSWFALRFSRKPAIKRENSNQVGVPSRAVDLQEIGFLIIVMFLYMGSQMTTLVWMPHLLAERFPQFSAAGSTMSLFWIGVLLGRLILARIPSGRVKSHSLLRICLVGGSLFSLAITLPIVSTRESVLLLLLVGLSTAGIYPLILDLGVSLMPLSRGLATGLLMTGAQLGNTVFSRLSLVIETYQGFLVGVLMPGILLGLGALINRKINQPDL